MMNIKEEKRRKKKIPIKSFCFCHHLRIGILLSCLAAFKIVFLHCDVIFMTIMHPISHSIKKDPYALSLM